MDALPQPTPSVAPPPSSLRDAAEAVRQQPRTGSIPPSDPQLVLTITPSVMAYLLLRLAIWAFYIGIVVAGLLIANRLVGFDIIGYLLKAGRDALANTEAFVPGFAAAAGKVLSTLRTLLITLGAVVTATILLRSIPLFTARWKLYEDRLEYRGGGVVVKERMVPLAAIGVVGSDRVLPFLDIGSITLIVSGITTRPISIPMVANAEEKAERIRNLLSAKQQATMQSNSLAPAPQTL